MLEMFVILPESMMPHVCVYINFVNGSQAGTSYNGLYGMLCPKGVPFSGLSV